MIETMPLHNIRTLLRIIESRGYAVDDALQAINLPWNPLEHSDHTNQAIPVIVYSRLYKYVMDLFQDESFGLGLSGTAPPGTFRMMCLYIIHCKNLRQAILRSNEFFDFCASFNSTTNIKNKTNALQPIKKMKSGDVLCRLININRSPQHTSSHSDASILYMMHRFYCWLIQDDIPLKGIHLTTTEPVSQELFSRLFSTDVQFNQPSTALIFSEKYLDAPIKQTENSLKSFLKTAPYELISGSSISNSKTSFIEQALLVIHQDFNHHFPSAEKLAKKMNISSRTLHRRLQQENTTYQALKDDKRKIMATNYLDKKELPISAVATLMGFNNTSAFDRAFKKWTGLSPNQYRLTTIKKQQDKK
jgi:AraC-like DNA-binding protein